MTLYNVIEIINTKKTIKKPFSTSCHTHFKLFRPFLTDNNLCTYFCGFIQSWDYYHGLRGSASPVLTATGFVNGRWQFSTPHRIHTP